MLLILAKSELDFSFYFPMVKVVCLLERLSGGEGSKWFCVSLIDFFPPFSESFQPRKVSFSLE